MSVEDRGFVAIPNSLIRDPSVPAKFRMLYGVILSYSYGRSGVCTVSTQRLCEESGLGRTAFFEGIAVLEAEGWIEIIKQKGPNGWKNIYNPMTRGVDIDDSEGSSPSERPGGVVRHMNGGSFATRSQKKKKGEEEEPNPFPSLTGSKRKRDSELAAFSETFAEQNYGHKDAHHAVRGAVSQGASTEEEVRAWVAKWQPKVARTSVQKAQVSTPPGR